MAQKRVPCWGTLHAAEGKSPLCALHLAGLHALGADVGLAHMAVLILDGDLLDVRTERAVRDAMGVADATTSNRGFTANFANLGHVNQLQ